MMQLLLNAILGAIANRTAGHGDVFGISGKLWNVAIYTLTLVWLGYDIYSYTEYTTWMIWLSIPAFWLIRQLGRGVAVAMAMEVLILPNDKKIAHEAYMSDSSLSDVTLRVDNALIQNFLEWIGVDWRTHPKTWAFCFNTLFGLMRGIVLSVLLLNPLMMLCGLQGVAFWLGAKFKTLKWEWGEYFNGAFIFLGMIR